MARVGIISCKIFEYEIAHLIKADPNLTNIYLIKSQHSQVLEYLLLKNNVNFISINDTDVTNLPPAIGSEIVVNILEIGLHGLKSRLMPVIMDRIRLLSPAVEKTLVLYGLCGNFLADLGKQADSEGLLIVIPKDSEGYVLDDCVGMIMGSKKAYLDEMTNDPGTFFMTCGWAKYYPVLITKLIGARSWDMVRAFLRDYSHCDRVLGLRTEVEDPMFEQICRKFAESTGLRLEFKDVSLDLLRETWFKTRS